MSMIEEVSHRLRREELYKAWDAVAAAREQADAEIAKQEKKAPEQVGYSPYDSHRSANAPVAVLADFRLDTVGTAKKRHSEWDEFAGTTPKVRKMQVDQMEVSSVLPSSPKAMKLSIPDSELDRMVDEVFSWGTRFWSAITGTNNNEQTDNQNANGRNPDGTVNPFTAGRGMMTREERDRLRQITADMSKLLDKLHELLEDDKFEEVMNAIILMSIEARKDATELTRDKMVETYGKKGQLSKKQRAEADILLQAAKDNRVFKMFEEVATTLGLVASAALTTGSGGWGVVALVYALGAAYNSYQGHKVENAVAKGVAWIGHEAMGYDKKPIESKVAETLRFGSIFGNGILAVAMGGMGNWVSVMLQGATRMVNGKLTVEANRSEGRHYKIGKDVEKEQKSLSGCVKELSESFAHQMRDRKLQASTHHKRKEVETDLVRSIAT